MKHIIEFYAFKFEFLLRGYKWIYAHDSNYIYRSSASDAVKTDIDSKLNSNNKSNILYRIIDRNKSYESINVRLITSPG